LIFLKLTLEQFKQEGSIDMLTMKDQFFLHLFQIIIIPVFVILFVFTAGVQIEAETIQLATTTSTDDSGLLEELLPIFREETGYQVDVIALGTGQALEIGRRGDADVLMVHAPELEKEFVDKGYGTARHHIMYNDFVLAGPESDPAGLGKENGLIAALHRMYQSGTRGEATFASRGDESGTYVKERELWEAADLEVEKENWYLSLGQGMGDTLITANEMQAYTLTDRGTFLAMKDNLTNLTLLFEGDEKLINPYGIIPVNPERHSHINISGAEALVEFFRSDDIQNKIGEFGKDYYGQPLFFPDAESKKYYLRND